MAVPQTTFNWYDESYIGELDQIVELDDAPLFMYVGSYDKGPENLIRVKGKDYYDLFGQANYKRHGLGSLIAKNLIDAGAELFMKRVVADDATLANLIILVKVTTTKTQKTDESGNPIYIDDSGVETTDSTATGATPVEINKVSLKWSCESIENCKTFDDVVKAAKKKITDDTFPIFVYCDNGRGVSKKAVRIIPDYVSSKSIGQMFYSNKIYEGTSDLETKDITINPNVIYMKNNYGLSTDTNMQVNGIIIEEAYDAYIAKLSTDLGIEESLLKKYDTIFGYDYKGSIIDNLTVDQEGIDLNSSYGVELKGGSNGVFGDAPVNTEAWENAILDVYTGRYDDEVWDVDQHLVCAILDADYPTSIKNAISEFVTFRKDCVFFRDLGTEIHNYYEILDSSKKNCTIKNNFIGDYFTTYDVKDPYTRKNINVTMLYDMALLLVDHFAGPFNAPLAGYVNNFVLPSAIKGTINFTPRKTPQVDQKKAIDDLRINYAIFNGDDCVVQSLYTSQAAEKHTELSYLSNTIAIQEVARAVRTRCPRRRYMLVEGFDFEAYAEDVREVLSLFKKYFYTLEFAYQANDKESANKIFHGVIRFAFAEWAQAEVFDLVAVNTVQLTES